jgi:hypothetical protein
LYKIIFQMPTLFVIEGMYAVGMKYHGPRQLEVGNPYILRREKNNAFDSNSITVNRKEDGSTKAYLTSTSARKLAPIMDSDDVIIGNNTQLKAKKVAEYRNYRLEQYCHVVFLVNEDKLALARSLLGGVVFRVEYV